MTKHSCFGCRHAREEAHYTRVRAALDAAPVAPSDPACRVCGDISPLTVVLTRRQDQAMMRWESLSNERGQVGRGRAADML